MTVHFVIYFEPALAPEGMTPEHFQTLAEEAVDDYLSRGLLRIGHARRRELRRLISWDAFFEEALRGPIARECPALAGPVLQFGAWPRFLDEADGDWVAVAQWASVQGHPVRLDFSRMLP